GDMYHRYLSLYFLLSYSQVQEFCMKETIVAEGSHDGDSSETSRQHTSRIRRPIGPRYKWVALTNTTIGVLMASIDASIVLISMPAIFNGIGVAPLAP